MDKILNKKPPSTEIFSKSTDASRVNAHNITNLVIANSEVIDLDAISIESFLSETERVVLEKRKSAQAKKEYLASRFLIKQLAQQFVSAEFSVLATVFDEQTKQLILCLNNKPLPLNLVISHSKGWVSVYLSDSSERVGIDLEYVTPERPCLKLAKHFYHTDEVNEIEKSQPMHQAFFRIWTLKEALAKTIAQPIAKLLAPNVYDTYAQYGISAYCCSVNNFDFSFASPLNTAKPPSLILVELSSKLCALKQSAVNRLNHTI